MPQQTNLNISPYYDDFDRTDNYHRVLFKPGYPVQARELTNLQSIMQNQVEQFGSHIFKEGSVVVPGACHYDGQYFCVKLDPTHLGTDIEVYLQDIVGKRIKGETSDVTALVVNYITSETSTENHPTLYIKYLRPGPSGDFQYFENSENLLLEEQVTYGNTTLGEGSSFASTISIDASTIGTSASIGDGVYFVRGAFVRVNQQTIILEQYHNAPFYRIGLQVVEKAVNAKEDPKLYDNAKGYSNYAAPGADRLKIELVLTKKETEEKDDTDFIELMRVRAGRIETWEKRDPQYNMIRDYIAKRTHDESGDYTVSPFFVNVRNSLNDRKGNDGLFYANEPTVEGNTPNDDLACVKISPGTAYIKGYEFKTFGTTVDVLKPRTTQEEFNRESFALQMGNSVTVNNVSGITTFRNTIDLQLADATGSGKTKIGEAKVYNFGLVDAKYEDAATDFDLFLYDVQTYTTLDLNDYVSSNEVNASAYLRGNQSGATAYAVNAGAGSSTLTITQTSGVFQPGEQIIVNGKEENVSRTVEKVITYDMNDVTSFAQSGNSFTADKKLYGKVPFGFNATDQVRITTGGVVTSPGRTFERFQPGDIIRYQIPGNSRIQQNVVEVVANTGANMTVRAISSVTNLYNGALPGSTYEGQIRIGEQDLVSNDGGGLYLRLPATNVADIDFTGSEMIFSEQVTGESTDANGVLVVSTSSIDIDDINFVAFDQERYQVQYSNGNIAEIDQSQVEVATNTLTINGLNFNQSGIRVNVTVSKKNIKSKVKSYLKSQTTEIIYSNNSGSGTNASSTLNDGLTSKQLYGTRVQDEHICLNHPDVSEVVAVYESLDNNAPIFDKLIFTSTDSILSEAIVGEDILGATTNAVARVVSVDAGSSSISVVYRTADKFNLLEELNFQDSNTSSILQAVSPGKYRDVTDLFVLDSGQREQYYDYSRLVRFDNSYIPSRKLSIVFDRYEIPSADTGDIFTVNSYDAERFNHDIPLIGMNKVRATDTLDFRPRVSEYSPASASFSPFYQSSRIFNDEPKRITTPNESAEFGFKNYLGRIDKLIMKTAGNVVVSKGTPSNNPKPPADELDGMTIAVITMPAYLYDINDSAVYLMDNRRYTMRDIGRIEDRVGNLEKVTSLSLLEQKVATLQVKDADGLDRFKSGFFADSFKSSDFVDVSSPIDVDVDKGELRPLNDLSSVDMQLLPSTQLPPEELDLSQDFALLDNNTRKTGRMITLNYEEEVFVSQDFATRVNNLNPFLVHKFKGDVTLNPSSDNWISTRRSRTLQTQTIRRTSYDTRLSVNNIDGGFGDDELRMSESSGVRSVERDDIRSENTYIASETFDPWCRSRNVAFNVQCLRPFSRYFIFFDQVGTVDVVPKIIGITNVIGAFSVGETITALVGGETFRFRLCRPDHKEGPFANPTRVFEQNPLDRNETLPTAYSQGSTVINIDCNALAAAAQGDFFGFLPIGTVIAGETSGAQATISNAGAQQGAGLELRTDAYGDVYGAVWIRDPERTPTPLARIRSGEREFKVTSSSTNATGLRGSTLISSGAATYTAVGTTRNVQTDVRVTTLETTTIERNYGLTFVNRRPPPPHEPPAPDPPVIIVMPPRTVRVPGPPVPNPIPGPPVPGPPVFVPVPNPIPNPIPTPVPTQEANQDDPLAQSFMVDQFGAYVTSVDVYFATIDTDPSRPAFVQLREMELGIPKKEIINKDAIVFLNSADIQTSVDASIPTHVTFPSPVYLKPATEYAFIVGAPANGYEIFTAEMGQTALNAQNLPTAAGRVYANQFLVGNMFKSSNGRTWTPSQFEDLTFKLYRAKFTSDDGVITFQNPPLRSNNATLPPLNTDPIQALPKKAAVGFTTTTTPGHIGTVFVPGRKVGDSTATYRYGYIEDRGGPATGVVGINTGGLNYGTPLAAVRTFNITGKGTGLKLGVTVGAGASAITAATISIAGNGYKVGDMVGIVTADMSGSGTGVRIGINSINGLDTLYLTGMQAEEFTAGANLNYFHEAGTVVDSGQDVYRYDATGSIYTGEYARINHFNHGMYGIGNKVEVSGVEPNTLPSTLSTLVNSTTTSVSIADSTGFDVFEGVLVSAANTGYAKINNEVISYTTVGINTLSGIVRGVDNTQSINHTEGSVISKYEFAGVSLSKINAEHDVSPLEKKMDDYVIKVDRGGRSADNGGLSMPQLGFNAEIYGGGANAHASKNIQYNTIVPAFDVTTPGATDSAVVNVRTVSGTSVDGNETSFTDLGFLPCAVNQETKLPSTRIVASEVNEKNSLTSLFRNKSLTTRIAISNGGNFWSSPMLCLDTANVQFTSSRLNKPIGNYATDPRANVLTGDLHTSYYQSKIINIKQPATSLKVVFDAFRPASVDFRVMYSLVRGDSSEIEQSFELFPGYLNSVDTTGDGFGDTMLDSAANDGQADKFILPAYKWNEYQYTRNDLSPFTGFVIKIVLSGTNQADIPIIKNVRALALA